MKRILLENTLSSLLEKQMFLNYLTRGCSGEGSGTPLQYSCPENPMDGGAWWAAVHGVAKSRTWLSDFTFTFHFHALEKEMATHSRVLAWRIPGTGKPGGLPSIGSHRVGHDWSDLAAAEAADVMQAETCPGQLEFPSWFCSACKVQGAFSLTIANKTQTFSDFALSFLFV